MAFVAVTLVQTTALAALTAPVLRVHILPHEPPAFSRAAIDPWRSRPPPTIRIDRRRLAAAELDPVVSGGALCPTS
jgi:hypothetical protein